MADAAKLVQIEALQVMMEVFGLWHDFCYNFAKFQPDQEMARLSDAMWPTNLSESLLTS